MLYSPLEELMGIHVIPLIIVAVYLAGLLSIGYWVKKFRIKTSVDYMLGGRRIGVFFTAASLAANNLGAASTTGEASRAFEGWGLSAGWYVLAASIGIIPLVYFAPKIRRTMAYTIPEVIRRRFGDMAGTTTALLNIISLFCLTASQILASGIVVSIIVGIPLNVAIIVSGAIILGYTVMGGVVADIVSDAFQLFIIIAGLLVAMLVIVNNTGGFAHMAAKLPGKALSLTGAGWAAIISLIINYFCAFLSGPEMVSRFSSAADEKTARNASWISAIFMALVAFIPAVIGLVVLEMNPGLNDDKGASVLMWAATHYASPAIAGIVAVAVISATMSSADSNLICAATIFVKDIFQPHIEYQVEDKTLILISRISIVFFGLLGMVIALLQINLITLNLFAFALRASGPFAAYSLALVWDKATRHSGLAAIVCGSTGAVVWQILGQPFGIMAIVFGCAAGVCSFALTVFIERALGAEPAPSPYVNDVPEGETAESNSSG